MAALAHIAFISVLLHLATFNPHLQCVKAHLLQMSLQLLPPSIL
jgi:hypothetical protein